MSHECCLLREGPERFGAESVPSQVALGEDLLEIIGRWFQRDTDRARGLRRAVSDPQPRDKAAWAGVAW